MIVGQLCYSSYGLLKDKLGGLDVDEGRRIVRCLTPPCGETLPGPVTHPDDVMGPPLTEFVAFRCGLPMASGLARHALAEGIDRSTLIRCLVREACAVRGINVTSI